MSKDSAILDGVNVKELAIFKSHKDLGRIGDREGSKRDTLLQFIRESLSGASLRGHSKSEYATTSHMEIDG